MRYWTEGKQMDWIGRGDVRVDDWDKVEEVIDTVDVDTTVVVTGPFNEEKDTDYRVRWCKGTDLEPIGGVKGDEDAQIHYLHPEAGWLEIKAFME